MAAQTEPASSPLPKLQRLTPKLSTAVGSFAEMPPVALLCQYLPDEEERRAFVESMALVKVKLGECIMRQGDKGNNFYIIKEGSCDVEIETNERGESLLTGNARSATVICTSDELTLLMVNRRMFNSCIGNEISKKRDALLPFLSGVSIFAELRDPYECYLVADAIVTRHFPHGTIIHEAGRPSDGHFYLVESGSVEVPNSMKKYSRGDYFGQVELLQGAVIQERRVAMVTEAGQSAVVCHTLSKDDFMKLVPLHAFVKETQQQQFALENDTGAHKMRGRRFGESAETTIGAMSPPTFKPPHGSKKSAEAQARILAAIKRNIIFMRLNEQQLQQLQQVMNEHKVRAGQNVVTQGEKGNHFYIVDSGELDVYVRPDGETVEQAVKSFRAGDSFGELALMYNCPRTATIRARTDVVVWSLDRVSFRMILLEANTKKTTMYESFLEKVQLLDGLSKEQRNRMVDALEEVQYEPGETIINEDENGTHFYMIVEGNVSVTKHGQKGELANRSTSDYFGELSLKTGSKTMATVRATGSKPCKLVRMDRGAFQRLLGPLSTIPMRKYAPSGAELTDEQAQSAGLAQTSLTAVPIDHIFEKASGPLSLSDFVVTSSKLGEGAFGKVRRCQEISTGKVFALKQMNKASIIASGQVEHIMQETEILSKVSHPFVANKYVSFCTQSNLIIIMEFCPGGDLFDQLFKHKCFSPQDTAIFTSQVLLPIEYLHSLGIVHRDLKLENILVAQDGALKLTDFGFAKYIKYRSWTLCGTPEYLAPELILEKGHGKAVDWWAFGVLFFEMLNGHSPFEAEDHLATYQKILDGTIKYPSKMDAQAVDLIGKLLQKDISRRFGNLKDGTSDIKKHRFYTDRNFNFENFAQRGSCFNVAQFDPSKCTWEPAERYVTEDDPCKPGDQAFFEGF